MRRLPGRCRQHGNGRASGPARRAAGAFGTPPQRRSCRVPAFRLQLIRARLPGVPAAARCRIVFDPLISNEGRAVAAARDWVAGARPRTLPAAIVPVAVGSGVAFGYGRFWLWRAVLALLVALALQVGVNYANDYSDGIRGTDERRVGPVRLVGSGLAKPRHVLVAALGCFAVAGAAGLVLAAVTSWWLLVLGALAIAAAWFYPGGSQPYGYRALGEVAVFLFFGLAAVAGTAYVQMGAVAWLGGAAGRAGRAVPPAPLGVDK